MSRAILFPLLLLALCLPACGSSGHAEADSASEATPDGDSDLDSEADSDLDSDAEAMSEAESEDVTSEADGDSESADVDSDSEAESAEADTNPDLGLDTYGGSKNYTMPPTGFFRVANVKNRYWLITPDGHPFFSAGMVHVHIYGTATADGQYHYHDAALAKYGTEEAWRDAQLTRLHEWGWNTIGAWSQVDLFRTQMPYTVMMDIVGSGYGDNNQTDLFTDAFETTARSVLTGATDGRVNDPFLIGYFTDNEMHWGLDYVKGKHLFDDYMAKDATAPGKQRIVQFLKERYVTLQALARDFTFTASTWDDLLAVTALPIRSDPGAQSARAAWTATVAERYFSVTNAILRELDPNHLNLGVRFVSQIVPASVIRVAGNYVDVMSINFYDLADGTAETMTALDPDYLSVDNYLEAHFKEGGRPILISEWGYRAADSGLPNSYPPDWFYPVLATQKDRADAYENKVREILARPWFVGEHWFEYIDEPPEGRFDGEDNNFGFLSEQDVPYQPMVERSALMAKEFYKSVPYSP